MVIDILYLYDFDKNLIKIIDNTINLQKTTELKDDKKTLTFSLKRDSSIVEEQYIRGYGEEWVIKEILDDGEWMDVTAIANVEKLARTPFVNFTTTNKTLNQTLTTLFDALLGVDPPGWTYVISTELSGYTDILAKQRTISLQRTDALSIIKSIAETFFVEYEIDSLNKVVTWYFHRGTAKGTYFTDELNLREIRLNKDSYDYITRLIPIGKDNLNISSVNGGLVNVDNFQYSDKILAAYWVDNRYTVPASLKADAELKLAELSKPKRSYQCQIIDLASVSDTYSVLDYDVGDEVTIISKNMAIKDVQRIVKLVEFPYEPERNSAELSNRMPSFEDVQNLLLDSRDTVNSFTNQDGTVIGSNVEVNIDGTTKDLNTALTEIEAEVKYIFVTGSNVFKTIGGVTSPDNVVLTASANVVYPNKWYVNGVEVTDGVSIDKYTYTLSKTLIESEDILTVKVESNETEFYDIISVYRLEDGSTGYTVVLSNPAFVLPTSSDNYPLSTSSVSTNITVYRGATPVVFTLGTVSSAYGFTASQTDSSVTLNYAINTLITANSGTFTIPITVDGISLDHVWSWAVSKQGLNGTNGEDGNDGVDAIVGILTNDSHTVPTDEDGNNGNYTGASSQLSILEGVTDVTSNYSISIQASSGVTTSGTNPVSVTVMSVDSGYVDFTAERVGYPTIVKRFTITKNKQGISGTDGDDGLNAKSYWLITDVPVLKQDLTGSFTPSALNVTAKIQEGLTVGTYAGRYIIAESDDGTNFIYNEYTSSADENGKAYTITRTSTVAVRVRLYLAGGTTTLLDEQIITVVLDGPEGTAGANAISGVLSNDSHGIPTDEDGTPISGAFTGAFTDMLIYEGATLQSASAWSYGAVPTNVTGSFGSGGTVNRYSVTAMSADTGYVDITASRSGYSSITKRFTLTKNKQGLEGTPATPPQYVIVSGEQAFKFLEGSSTPTQSTIELTASLFGGLTIYDWEFHNGTGWQDLSGTNSGQTYILAYDNSAWTNTKLRVRCLSGTTWDEITIVKLYDGSNGLDGDDGVSPLSGYLTNESVTVPANVLGEDYVLTSAGGTFKVFEGTTDRTTSSAFAITGGTDNGSTWSKVQNGLTFTINETTGVYSLSGAGNSWSSDFESFVVTATFSGTTISKAYKIAKAKQGAAGADGDDSQYVIVNGEQSFKFLAGESIPTQTSIVLGASLFGGLTAYDWEYWNGSGWVDLATPPANQNQTYTLTYNHAGWTTDSLRVRCLSSTFYDEITIVKLYDGSDGTDGDDGVNAKSGYLTNESVSVPSFFDGTGYSLTGAGGTFKVFDGITDVTTSSSFSGTATKNGLTLTINASTGVYTLSGASWTTDLESFELNATYSGTTITKTYTIAKAKQGLDGEVYYLESSDAVVTKSKTGTLTPASLTFYAKKRIGDESPSALIANFRKQVSTDGINFGTASDTASVSQISHTVGGTDKAIRVSIYKAGAYTELLDVQTIRVVTDGSDGNPGTSPYFVTLGNESQNVPTNSAGATTSAINIYSTFGTYQGTSRIASVLGTITMHQANGTQISTGITITSANATTGADGWVNVAITSGTNLPSDSGYINIPYNTPSGFTRRIAWAKTKAGVDGTNGADGDDAQYVIVTGEQVFSYDAGASIPTPTSITLTATLVGGLTTYDWEYWNGSAWVNLGGTNTNQTYAVAYDNVAWGVNKSLRVRCLSGTNFDETTLIKVYDGDNGTNGTSPIVGYLTNESVTVPTLFDGTGYSLASAGGTLKIFEGVTDRTTASIFNITGGVDGGTTWTKTQNGLVMTINETTGVYSLSGTWTSDTESFTLNGVYGGVTVSKLYTITKAKAGTNGTNGIDGDDAQYVVVNGPQSFKYLAGSSTPVTSPITLTASLFGGLTVYDWEYWNGSAWTNLSGTQNTSTYSMAHDNAAWGASTFLRVRCLSGTQFDEITIVKLYDGTNGTNGISPITGYLTNEVVTVSALANGTGYSLTGAGGTFKMYEGITDRTTASTFNITGGTDAGTTWTKLQNGLTFTINETTGVYTLSGASWTSDTESFTVTGTYGGTTITKVYTITKAKAGTDGTSPQIVNVDGPQSFKYLAGQSTPTVTPITLTAQLFGGLTTYDWEYWNGSAWTNLSGTQNTSTYSLAYDNAAWSTNTSLRIRCLSGSAFDEITIVKLYDGTNGTNGTNGVDGVTGILANPSHTLPASSAGVVSSYTGSGTTIKVFEGSTALQFNTVLANGRFIVGTPVVAPSAQITVGARSGSGTTTCTVADHSAMNNATDSVTITYPITARRSNGTDVTFDLVQTITKSKAGTNGTDGADALNVIITPTSTFFTSVDNGESYTPTSIVLTPTFYNGATYTRWEYNIGAGWVTVGTLSGISIDGTSKALTVAWDTELFDTVTSVSFKIVASTVEDVVTLAKFFDSREELSTIGETLETITNFNVSIDSQVTGLTTTYTELNTTVNGNGEVVGLVEKTTTLRQDVDELSANFERSGSGNLIKNSVGFAGTELWTVVGTSPTTVDNAWFTGTVSKRGWTFGATGSISQSIGTLADKQLIFTGKYNKTNSVAGSYLRVSITHSGGTTTYALNVNAQTSGEFELIINPTSDGVTVTIESVSGGTGQISDLMLSYGRSIVWGQSDGELYATNITLNELGISVGSNTGYKTIMTPLEFSGYNNNVKVFELTGDSLTIEKVIISEKFTMRPIEIINSSTGWDFVWVGV